MTTVEKVTPDRKEKEPMKVKDEKGKVPLSKMLRKPEAVNAKVTPKATNVWWIILQLLLSCS